MTVEEDNKKAFENMLIEKEDQDERNLSKYRYFEDEYNYQYRWTIYRQKDNKFHAQIYKFKVRNGWGRYTKSKDRAFRKRKDAKAYCLKECRKARSHQEEVLQGRADRKQARLDAKPTFSKVEVTLIESRKQIEHYRKLIKRANAKIKGAETRKHTYEKRIRVMQKRIDKVMIIA